MLERLLQYLGLPAAIASCVGLTWDSLTGLELIPRLVATLILAVTVQELLARLMTPAPPDQNVGFRPRDQQPAGPSKWRAAVSLVLLTVSAALTCALAWLQTERLVISGTREGSLGTQSLEISASWVKADYVVLLLPPGVRCDLREVGADLTIIDWEQPDRTLRIDNFVSPQSVFIKCETDVLLAQRGIEIGGPADGIYFESELFWYRIAIIVAGVLIWLYGMVRLRQLS